MQQISFGCFSCTHKQKPGHIYIQGGILSAASVLEDYTLVLPETSGSGLWPEEDRGV